MVETMTEESGARPAQALSADEAFVVLGNETRLQMLKILCEADSPLAYSELFDRIEYDDSANFTYHLEKLVGHFVRKTEEGYLPRLAGRRIVETIFSGIVTDTPVIERTDVGGNCMYCGNSREMAYYDEVAVVYCRACEGQIGELAEKWPICNSDIVGYVSVPPAGVYDRSPTEVLEAAGIWTIADVQAIVRGVCPRCSAPIDRSAQVCADHDAGEKFCEQCDHQFAVRVAVSCTNCTFSTRSPYPTHAVSNLDLIGFMADHGIDPFASNGFHLSAAKEEVLSVDPLEARYTFTADDESIALTVDEDLSVVDVSRG